MKPLDWSAPQRPTNEAQFESMMQSLDAHLAAQDKHVHQRPLNAAWYLAMAYGEGIAMPVIPAPRMEDYPPYSGGYLCARCHHWYEARYGDELKIRPEIGYFVVPLRHRVWKVRTPFFYGTADIYLDRTLQVRPAQNVISRGPIAINILDCFEKMQQPYADALSDEELDFAAERFKLAYDALSLLDQLDQGPPLFRQARIDYNHSVEALCSIERSYGKARRDIATSAEKVMKGLLDAKNIVFEKNHHLNDLARKLNEHCGLEIDTDLMAKLYSPASVSYEQDVSREEALEAHANWLRLMAHLASRLS